MRRLVTAMALAALRRWRSGADGDAIAGDLAEQLHGGRSTAWLVYQVVAAIVTGAVQDARAHGGAVTAGFLAGGAFVWVFRGFIAWPLINLDTWLFTVGATRAFGSWGLWHAAAPWMVFGLCYAAGGWLAARIGRGAPAAAVLTLAAWIGAAHTFDLIVARKAFLPTPFAPVWLALLFWFGIPLSATIMGGVLGAPRVSRTVPSAF